MRNILDVYKYLDKNGLKRLIEKIKKHDYHWTGTHAEYEAVKDTIPAYAILHFTDDYDDGYGAPFSRSYINTGAPAYGDVVLASTNVYDAIEELVRSWKTKSDAERRAFACTGLITLKSTDDDTRVPFLCGSYLLTTQRGTDTGTNYFVRLEVWQNTGDFAASGQVILTATLTQMGIFNCDYSIINQPYSTSELPTGKRWIDGKPIYSRVVTGLSVAVNQGASWVSVCSVPNAENLVTYRIKPSLDSDWSANALCRLLSGTCQLYNCGGLNMIVSCLILEYTKTTD